MTTTQITAGTGDDRNTRSSSVQAQWSDLPDDILGSIRLRIASLRDRVRLLAVCRPWRAALARIPAPPAGPVLLLSPRRWTGEKKFLCGGGPGDSWVLRVPEKAAENWLIGSHEGGWVAAFERSTRKLTLVNLFSGAEVGVCPLWEANPHVIMSDDPTSSNGCILATIASNSKNILLCKVGHRSGWTIHGREKMFFFGIAFCNGDLYGLVFPFEELIRFKVSMEEDSPTVISAHQLAVQRHHGPAALTSYLVELRGKLSKAILTQWLPNHEPFFKVFELVDADNFENYQYKWSEVTSLGEYALFLGPTKSKAVHVPMGTERRGFERNHIYYSKAAVFRESKLPGVEVYTIRSEVGRTMYCRKHQSIGDGIERTGYYLQGTQNDCMWLHPPNL